MERRINETPELAAQYSAAPDDTSRRYLLLAFGAWLSAPPVVENSNVGTAQPPEDVHAMARGPLAAAGGMYEADLVADALASAGVEITSLSSGLDFGCSSGRVVSVLAAAYPEINWHGCDPNTRAVTWAAENHPKVDFFVNGDAPPLPLQDGSLDLAFAISIWSHFAPELGLRWFDDMYRADGMVAIWSHHTWDDLGRLYAQLSLRTPRSRRDRRFALPPGWWYAPEFGEEGDWGVVNPDWGTAFLISRVGACATLPTLACS